MQLPVLLGLGAVALWLHSKKSSAAEPGEIVTKNGHTWILRAQSNPPGQVGATTTKVYAPRGSWGPHEELLVLSYYVAIAPNAPRMLSGVGANVPVAIRDAAIADLGVEVPGAS